MKKLRMMGGTKKKSTLFKGGMFGVGKGGAYSKKKSSQWKGGAFGKW